MYREREIYIYIYIYNIEKALILREPLPGNTAAEAAIQPLTWCQFN